ncbi:hypothetical protein [Vibrio sp. L3-7]|uniref:hypothetical protein n=1 Tax=Vibrio sp. L3-7 TaxID=2912253 RepID=UPI001F3DE496|nr:hypothetical protein [Vibrio sp. L3-7]MCF7505049.1 hypothetical protein [Vibrio sp. L3-7]
MNIVDTLLLALITGVAGFFGAYVNVRAKNIATKTDFDNLKDQLSQNTTVVESVKNEFSDKSWVSQQVWVKKQEAYEDILQKLLHIQKYVNHQLDDYQDYEYVNYLYHISIEEEFDPEEVDKATKYYEECNKRLQLNKDNKIDEKLRTSSINAINHIFDLIFSKSIYLDPEVEKVISGLQFVVFYDSNEVDDEASHYRTVRKAMTEALKKVQEIARQELKINITSALNGTKTVG